MEQKVEVDYDDYVDYVDYEDDCEADNAVKTSGSNNAKKDAAIAKMRVMKSTDSKENDYYYDIATGEQRKSFCILNSINSQGKKGLPSTDTGG